MKNKLKYTVVLAIVLTLALLALTGCVKTNTKYNINGIDSIVISDAVDEVLESCVVVETIYRSNKYGSSNTLYYCIGIAVSENKILVPRQAIPKKTALNMTSSTNYLAYVAGQDKTIALEYLSGDNSYLSEYGFSILSVYNSQENGIKLKPIKFGNSNVTIANGNDNENNLNIGQVLFGVELLLPDRIHIESKADDFYKVISANVAANGMHIGVGSAAHHPENISDIMKDNTFTTQGYFSKSDPYDSGDYPHDYDLLSNDKLYALTDTMLFNSKGEFVGLNYLRRTDSTSSNEHVVAGIGYALKSNIIKSILQKQNIEVA